MTAAPSRDAIAEALTRQYGTDGERARALAARACGATVPAAVERGARTIEAAELGKLEKEIEHACDKLARGLGFEVVRFSHPGRTKQTPGIPDRRYYHRRRGLVLWLEVKGPEGTQRPDQRAFQEMAEACGETYVLGGLGDFRQWLLANGWTHDDMPEAP